MLNNVLLVVMKRCSYVTYLLFATIFAIFLKDCEFLFPLQMWFCKVFNLLGAVGVPNIILQFVIGSYSCSTAVFIISVP